MRRPVIALSHHPPCGHSQPAADLLRSPRDVWISCSGHPPEATPPASPYRSRRLWLTTAEERGYLRGFAAALRAFCAGRAPAADPTTDDHAAYWEANVRFAAAVAAEAIGAAPVVLVHDYAVALTPRLIRTLVPGATIAAFWDLGWPEAAALARWRWSRELLEGLLGSDGIGFPTRGDCTRFLETVALTLETPVDEARGVLHYRARRIAVCEHPLLVTRLTRLEEWVVG